jgi:hypothetical protein
LAVYRWPFRVLGSRTGFLDMPQESNEHPHIKSQEPGQSSRPIAPVSLTAGSGSWAKPRLSRRILTVHLGRRSGELSPPMRREFIYPHRSVRSFPISRPRLFAALGMAVLLCAAVAYSSSTLVAAHDWISSSILSLTRIPVEGTSTVGIFPHLGSTIAPRIPFADYQANPFRLGLVFVVSVVGLLIVHRKVPLSRNFIIFLLILVCTAGAVLVFYRTFQFDSVSYGQIWLRGEMLVWLLLPWISAFLFMLTLPSLGGGVGWTLLLQVYAIVWSAVRLAFCLGVMHFTGILFLPLLWFCMGILFDLVYVLAIYSLALRLSIKNLKGERAS